MSGQDLTALTALLQRYGIAEFEYEDDSRHVVLSLGTAADAPPPAPAAPPVSTVAPVTVRAPYAGLFRLAPSGEPLPRMVRQAEILGNLQTGQLLRPVIAPEAGLLGQVLVAEGALTGYGTPLFVYRSTGRT